MDECFFGPGRLRRKSRTTFDRFLEHPNSKIREYALRCQMEIEDEKQRYRQMLELGLIVISLSRGSMTSTIASNPLSIALTNYHFKQAATRDRRDWNFSTTTLSFGR